MISFTELKEGNILGIIDAYGAVHSMFTGKVECHDTHYPENSHCKWRWNFNDSIYLIGGQKLTLEEYDSITNHIQKKYGIKWWENGHHDLDHFIQKLDEEKR